MVIKKEGEGKKGNYNKPVRKEMICARIKIKKCVFRRERENNEDIRKREGVEKNEKSGKIRKE